MISAWVLVTHRRKVALSPGALILARVFAVFLLGHDSQAEVTCFGNWVEREAFRLVLNS